jgi:maleate cis-trans isomerase
MVQPEKQFLVGSVWPTNRSGTLGDQELDPKLPAAIKLVHLTMDFQQGTEAEFAEAIPGYEVKVAELASQNADLIRVLGAPPFMIQGYDRERAIIGDWEKKYKVPMFTSSLNHCRAFTTLGVNKVVGATYLPANLNAIFARYLTEAGFDVLAIEGVDVPFHDVPKVPAMEFYGYLIEIFGRHPDAECLYMLGSAWKTLSIIDRLEETLGVPVVHPLPARSWETQMRLGLRQPIKGYGRLLAEMPAMA